MPKRQPATYEASGVSSETSLELLLRSLAEVSHLGATQRLGIGHYASVLEVGPNLGVALSTDGVGTKILVAQMADRYDTVGVDCVAMNVNDLLCVGATPITMVDYLAVQEPHPRLLEEIGRGLAEGARQANINICGGELAQIRPMLSGARPGWGFDLVGTALGLVDLDRIVDGRAIEDGDVILGIASSGLHSNGYSLARKVLLEGCGFKVDSYVEELGTTVGEELLKKTAIYVREVVELMESEVAVKGLVHVTSDGFGNLTRLETPMGFVIEKLSPGLVHPIFRLIQERGPVETPEMFQVYNMGIGFCVVVSKEDAPSALSILSRGGRAVMELGRVDKSLRKQVIITEPFNLAWSHEERRFSAR